MTRNELDNNLLTNVLDLRFVRRRPISTKPDTRRMLCTKSYELLNSINGRIALNYRPPANIPAYDIVSKNLIIVWDIFMQDYRTLPVESVNVLNTIPANEKFWTYFNENLRSMSSLDKIIFMQS